MARVPRGVSRPAGGRGRPVRRDPRRARAVGIGRAAAARRRARPASQRPIRRPASARSSPTARGRSAPAASRRRSWASRHGRPQRRFDRVFERLVAAGPRPRRALRAARVARAPGRGRAAAGGAEVQRDDATTLAAKRVFGIGDTVLLERRARALADAVELPIEALDLALSNWGARGRRAGDIRLDGGARTTASATRSPPCSASDRGVPLARASRCDVAARALRGSMLPM